METDKMTMKIKNSVCLLCAMGLSLITTAQVPLYTEVVQYSYDAAGNRIQRKIIYISQDDELLKTDTTTATDNTSFNDGQLQEGDSMLYKDNIGDVKIELFPNPTTGQIVVQLSDLEDENGTAITVNDMAGKFLRGIENISATNILDFSEYASGKYVVRIRIDSKQKEWLVVKY